MVWKPDGPQGYESDKVAAIVTQYTRGFCLDVGCGTRTVWPNCVGIDSGKQWGRKVSTILADGENLSQFADAGCDGVFSSHFLEHVVDYKATLKRWWRVIKPGGYLTLYLPHKELYPNIGQPGSNPDHKHDFMPADILDAMKEVAAESGADVVEDETRDQEDEYSFLQVFRKRADGEWNYRPWRKPDKACLVIRYSAIGDQLMASSILPQLKKQGWHVTYQGTPEAEEVLRHNPHIDAWWIQDKGQVPMDSLGAYFRSLEERFDKIVNLCGSVEDTLLLHPTALAYQWPHDLRHKDLGHINYLERTHDIAEVPYEFAPKFHPTEAELAEARRFKKSMNGPAVYFAINGTSIHKLYAHLDAVLLWLTQRTPCHIVMTADPGIGKHHQDALMTIIDRNGAKMDRVHGMAGKWSIRQSLTFAQVADCVVGPETGIIWSVFMERVPKIVMLSHSSFTNFSNHAAMMTTFESRGCPDSPCHKLHYEYANSCPLDETTRLPMCSSSIQPIEIFNAIIKALGLKRNAA